jgi:hypothetical protein
MTSPSESSAAAGDDRKSIARSDCRFSSRSALGDQDDHEIHGSIHSLD